MKVFHKILVLLVLAAIIFVSSFHVAGQARTPKSKGNESTTTSLSNPILAELSHKVAEQLNQKKSETSNEALSERVREDLATLKNSANYFNVEEIRRNIYANWANDERMMASIRAALLHDDGDEESIAGSFDAELRYFGIQAYLQLAKEGNSQALDETLLTISRDTSQHMAIANNTGRLTDFKDLIHAKLQTVGFEQLKDIQNLSAFLDEMQLTDVRNVDLKKAIDDEIFLFLYPRLGKEKTNRLLAATLPQEGMEP